MKKYHEWINTGLILLVAILLVVGGNQSGVGNSTASFWNTAGGYRVGGTEVISSSRALSVTSATLSTTLDVTGAVTVAGATIVDEFTQGGSILATSTDGTATTFLASDLLTYSGWEVTVNGADSTWTFPASSTLSAIVPSAGDSRTWTIVNATSTAAIDVIFAAGTGSAIKGSCGGGLTLDEASHGTLSLFRKANSDIVINTCFPTAD